MEKKKKQVLYNNLFDLQVLFLFLVLIDIHRCFGDAFSAYIQMFIFDFWLLGGIDELIIVFKGKMKISLVKNGYKFNSTFQIHTANIYKMTVGIKNKK